MRKPSRLLSFTLVLKVCILLTSCASLPTNFVREETRKLDATDTTLALAFDVRAATHQGQSGAYPLGQGIEALAARVALARAAEKSLDVQYYIWHPDMAGRLLLKELLDAADRGVRVRLLLDDIGVGAADDSGFLALDSNPNLSVSLFNPISSRDSRTMGLLRDPLRLNHRMHNKSMTADNTVTIVGGRNIGDEYFSLDELVNFADLDVLAIGPVADQVAGSFDEFWNADETIPISAFHTQSTSHEEYALARAKLNEGVAETGTPLYEAMAATHLGVNVESKDLEFHWGNITALIDAPEKAQGNNDTVLLIKQLGNLLGQTHTDLLIVSPYFIPGKPGTQALVAAAQRGVRIRIITNSLASTDVGAVHAGYKKSRRKLLEGGVELFEMMPDLQAHTEVVRRLSFSGSSAASLHAKTFVIDHERVFIGSMNLDPRSIDLNTEIGLLIDNSDLAHDLDDRLGKDLTALCYTVVLEPRNPAKPDGRKDLVWIESGDKEQKRHTKEPQTTFWQRAKIGFIGLLPVDSQL
ncbi:MAG: phospholipase D family protein [Proteobacteria bacterium]|nr:phospholipase D family protein [Pseudomonadota bacterium]